MRKFNLLPIIGLLAMLITSSCSEDDPIIPNQEELITTFKLTLTPVDGGSSTTFSFQDLDGDGGEAPIITSDTLSKNTSYYGTISLLNETASPAEDITSEIETEASEHQFFFSTSVNGLTIAYNDKDSNNHPIGLSTMIATTEVGSGTITVILRHEPDKSADGVADGDITNAGGETDIEVTFDVEVR